MRFAARLATLLGFAAACSFAGLAHAESRPASSDDQSGSETSDSEKTTGASERYEKLLDRGREAYNAENYSKAAEAYVEAAQTAPDRPKAYRNLARTYFWREQYARAIVYYDHYLKLVSEDKDVSKVERERKLAANRAGEEVWQRPASQKRVLEALRNALTDGKAYTKGGGGAWALYEALLRAGYVAPELAHLQDRLRQKLIEEFEGLLMTDGTQPVPVLSLEEWQRQQMRLEAARSVARDPEVAKIIDRRMAIAETALALLNGRHDDAVELADEAIEQNPDMKFLHWYRSVALVESGRPDRARRALDEFEKQADLEGTETPDYLQVLRAAIHHRTGETEAAAEAYRSILEK